jgi:DNA-directed RNA polymerase subunit alpha
MPVRVRWRGLELPVQVRVNKDTLTDCYGEFVVEPFERGLGHTVGNSIRRVLLSSLEGSAVVAVRIEGVQQEFSAIKGVKEDVAEVVLNLKELVVRLHPDAERAIRLEAHARGDVTGANIVPDPEVDIINPEHKIATLTDDVDFICEMTVRKGRGYVPEEELEGLPRVVGLIPMDALFSPVRRVAYRVEDTRVGRRTNYDRLILQVWTSGALSPEIALVEGSKILRKHLNPFVEYFEVGRLLPQEQPELLAQAATALAKPQIAESILSRPIKALNFSMRALNCLSSENVKTVGQLLQRSEEDLLNIRNFGEVTLQEIKDKLTEHGLEVGLLAKGE